MYLNSKPRNLKHNITIDDSKTQVNVTDIDVDNGELRGHISTFRASNVAKGRGKNRVQSGVNQITKQSLCDLQKSVDKDTQIKEN